MPFTSRSARPLLSSAWAALCCVSVCRRRSTLRWNERPHSSQANGLKPLCLRECVIRFDDCENALLHCAHLYGFSPARRSKDQSHFKFVPLSVKLRCPLYLIPLPPTHPLSLILVLADLQLEMVAEKSIWCLKRGFAPLKTKVHH